MVNLAGQQNSDFPLQKGSNNNDPINTKQPTIHNI